MAKPAMRGAADLEDDRHDKLAKAVAGINVSVTAKGILPPSDRKLTN